jgi:hypothetical protein
VCGYLFACYAIYLFATRATGTPFLSFSTAMTPGAKQAWNARASSPKIGAVITTFIEKGEKKEKEEEFMKKKMKKK